MGASPSLAATWFASVLRDGFALTAAGTSAPFAVVGAEVLRTLLPADGLNRSLDEAVEHVMAGFTELPVHPDVPEGLRALATTGRRLVDVVQRLGVRGGRAARAGRPQVVPGAAALGRGRRCVEARAAAYAYAAARCGVEARELMLVAVHPWDVDGAGRAGLRTAWLNRSGTSYPRPLPPPGPGGAVTRGPGPGAHVRAGLSARGVTWRCWSARGAVGRRGRSGLRAVSARPSVAHRGWSPSG